MLHLASGYPRAQMTGPHLSRFQGHGIEFDEVRLYQPGDEIRNMDWRVTARTGKPHTKLFREERERPAMVLVDFRPAMFFATRGALKAVIAAECAALLAWSVLHQGDRVGCMILDDDGSGTAAAIRPARGKRTVMRMLGQLACHRSWEQRPAPCQESLMRVLQRSAAAAPTGSLMIMVSDGRGLDAASELMMARLLTHHTILFVLVFDPFEKAMADVGHLYASDGQQQCSIDTGRESTRSEHAIRFRERREALARLQRHRGFILIECATDDDPFTVLKSRIGGRR
ncbi:DUF58 domain-containing protein [Mariprofundus erugo]|uniref:DUF58 domain-containing protein n=1 Tax=Mariprofundus erugo TaxID=2528639 RepID=A0A5R9GU30_9PROT|nr:DUF58 domain-containing protein [Mariprofundus erugo]TLS67923.1 DUF58 domain-containing protein [Mariprofundus erugo]